MQSVDYPGIDGFLGTRASVSLDLLFLGMIAIVPVLAWSVYQVKFRRRYGLHKRVQVVLGLLLLVAVVIFELDIRLNGWRERAAGQLGGDPPQIVWNALYIHLVFALAATVLWPVVIVRALRNFPNPCMPAPHSVFHKRWGLIAAIDMTITAVTGCTFYWLAFVSAR
jgi:putative membrane protein